MVSKPIFSHTNKYLLFSPQTFTEFLLGSVLGAEDIKVNKAQSSSSQNLQSAGGMVQQQMSNYSSYDDR